MGACQSGPNPEELRAAKVVDDINTKDKRAESRVSSLLLLGSGESGKSTVMKQLTRLYAEGYSDADRAQYKEAVHRQVLSSMLVLIQRLRGPSDAHLDALPKGEESIDADMEEFLKRSRGLTEGMSVELDKTLATIVAKIWASERVKALFNEEYSDLHVPESTKMFFDKVLQLSDESYIPSMDDFLRVRRRTTGIVTSGFSYKDFTFRIVDVGGQRTERRKWIQCFDGVTSIFYITAISEYDQTMFEDSTTNRMYDSLDLFKEVTQYDFFKKVSVVLFLNKKDLFDTKFPRKSLKDFFPDFDGKTTEDGYKFFEKKFRERMPADKQSDIFPHVVSALDEHNVDRIFTAVRDTLVGNAVQDLYLD